MKNNIIKYGLMAIMWIAFTVPAMADPGDPPGEDDPVDPAPIDNWILMLALAAIALGVYFLMNRKKAIA